MILGLHEEFLNGASWASVKSVKYPFYMQTKKLKPMVKSFLEGFVESSPRMGSG